MTLTCDTHSESNLFKLYKEHGTPIPQFHNRIFQKRLLLGPVTPAYAGTYRCYSYKHQYHNELSSYSDALKIIISGQRSYSFSTSFVVYFHSTNYSHLRICKTGFSQSLSIIKEYLTQGIGDYDEHNNISKDMYILFPEA